MKILQSSIFRAVTMIVVGVLLVKYREDTMRWLTIVIGLLFFISGLISVCFYLYEKQRLKNATPLFDAEGNEVGQRTPMFPFVGVGSMILGVILAMMSTSLNGGSMAAPFLLHRASAISNRSEASHSTTSAPRARMFSTLIFGAVRGMTMVAWVPSSFTP